MSVLQDLVGRKFKNLLVLKRINKKWLCRCDCGNLTQVATGSLNSGQTISCGCIRTNKYFTNPKFKDITGKIYGKLIVVQCVGKQKTERRKTAKMSWLCICECGNYTVACSSDLIQNSTKSCGCYFAEGMSHANWRGVGEIPGTYFTTTRRGATIRNLEFSITKEDMWYLFIKQNKKCILSGLELKFSNRKGETTASLDRIDSSKGYTKNNIQWIHKDINRMKLNLPQDTFIKYCRLIAEKTEIDKIRENFLRKFSS